MRPRSARGAAFLLRQPSHVKLEEAGRQGGLMIEAAPGQGDSNNS